MEKVSVQVLGVNHKITTPKHRFELLQTQAVSERRQALTLRVAIYEGEEAVTLLGKTMVFDSKSENLGERTQSVLLTLQPGSFDKKRDYRLVLRDADTGADVQTVPVVIDRSFEDDF